MSTIKVLLVEDEQMLAEIISDTLNNTHEFNIILAYDGLQALEFARKDSFDVIVTDIMMPKMDGFTFVKELRKEGDGTPVLFLTARSTTDDLVKGFGIGGNDYLKKPFDINELIVRIKALAGRAVVEVQSRETYSIGKYIFNTQANTLYYNHIDEETCIKLSARESAVLEYLCHNMGQTIESSVILNALWGSDNYFNLRSLNVYITKLRRHLENDPSIEIISIRGVGYRLQLT